MHISRTAPFFILSMILIGCAPRPVIVYQEPAGVPGLSIPGPYAESPVVMKNADSTQRTTGGIYLKSSDHQAEMTKNIVDRE